MRPYSASPPGLMRSIVICRIGGGACAAAGRSVIIAMSSNVDSDIALERGSNLETDEIVGIVETTFAVVRG